MKRNLVTFLVLSLVFLNITFSVFAQQNISIGAWNIQWLGSSDQRPGQADNIEQKPEDLAPVISSGKVDILALSEISDTDGNPETRTNRILDKTFAILNAEDGNKWKYVLFRKRSSTSNTQLTGIAWNEKAVKMVGEAFRIPLNIAANPNMWDRWATAAKFTTLEAGKTDFVVIPVHLKSNRGGVAVTSQQRQQEARALVNALNTVRNNFSDKDIVIIGDTNVKDRNEATVSTITNAGFKDLNNLDRPTDIRGDAFDRVFVRGNQPEFAQSEQSAFIPVGMSRQDFFIKCSDHYLIRFLVKIMNDDD